MKTIMRNQLVPLLNGELAPLHLLEGGKVLLAGVSGGADSVALLHGMALLRDSHDFSLAAVHVEHGLRGGESMKDAAFVKDLCMELHVPLHLYSVDVKKAMQAMRCGLEEAARILRYDCFAKAMQACGAGALLLAHHGDDQAETVLMHLMRGSGPAGLAGMARSVPFCGGLLVRPLLSLRHDTLVQALAEEGLAWREDETNAKPEGLRNSLRLSVMPALHRLSPGCTEAIGRTALLMDSEEGWWREEAFKWLRENARMEPDLCFFQREGFNGHHVAFRRRMARAFLEQAVSIMPVKPDADMTALSFEKTEEMLRCISGYGSSAVNLPYDVRGERSISRFFLIPPQKRLQKAAVPLTLNGETRFEGFSFTAAAWNPGIGPGDGIRCQALDSLMLEGAVFRTRRPGDTFRLLGGEGTQSLKEVFINRHVDRPFRDMLPVLCRGTEVLWIPGIGPSQTAAIRPGTQKGTVLTLLGPLPWDIAKDDQPNQ